jgi:beta-galactosidase
MTRASTFAIGEHDFLLDGEPFRILSGAIHYFRVHPEQWADRIRKARLMGLNTIETYVAWNAHAPREGEFDLLGDLDLGAFLDAVAAEGMYAIVRPGPYICAEWSNGGLPAWLFGDSSAGIRQDEPRYMSAVTRYLEQLAPVLVPRQIDRGGPIILVQVENEYGAYGSDKAYLRKLVEINRETGITVPLISVDQPVDDMLENGSLPELHRTGSFGSRAPERLDTLRRHQPTGPLMCSEFWDGWFDDWGSHHHVTSVEETARTLDQLLERGASVNIYMFHGGTNFGFTNGANDKGTYLPIVTSYDYDAPLDEAGNPTEKYWALRDVIAKYAPVGDEKPQPAAPPPAFDAAVRRVLPLWDVVDLLGQWASHDGLPTLDSLGHYEGFALYRTEIDATGPAVFHVEEVRDRALLFVNQQGAGVLARDHHDTTVTLPTSASGTLDLLVEDLGRVDYGPRLGEPKGLIGAAALNGEALRSWSVLPLDLADIAPVAQALEASGELDSPVIAGPAFASAYFDHPGSGDLYLDTAMWGKGVAWVNGFCLGRYWSRGPQRTLYVPGPVLRETGNELIMFELHAAAARGISFVSAAELGHTEA